MKKTRKTRTVIPIFIAIFAVILISSIVFFIYSLSGNYINYVNIDNSSEDIKDSIAKESNIIIVNGVVLGASKNGCWINANKFYTVNGSEGAHEVNLYSKTNLYGTYNTASLKQYKKRVVYTTIAKDTLPEQYLAISSGIDKSLSNMKVQEPTAQDEKYVMQALGGYRLLNASVNITEIYTANIKEPGDKIICVTAKQANIFGVYSAVIFVTGGEASLIKYSYVRDTNNSDRWPIYSVKFIHDLNGDRTPEIILEELTGNDVRYTALELRNKNTFYQVLSTSIEL